MATGVVLVAATTIVANPLVTSPPDKVISTAEWAANGDNQDSFGFGFLKSIGPGHSVLPAPIVGLEELLNGLINSAPEIIQAAAPITPELVVNTPVQTLGQNAITAKPENNAQPTVLAGVPNEVVEKAIAAIGGGTSAAGVKIIEQLAMAPAVVFSLLRQVMAGTLSAEDALRRLVLVPLAAAITGYPNLTGDPDIDAWYSEGSLRPLIDALINNLPFPFGQPGGSIEAIDGGLSGIAKHLQHDTDPPTQRKSSATADTAPALPPDPDAQSERPDREAGDSKIIAPDSDAAPKPRATDLTAAPNTGAPGKSAKTTKKSEPSARDDQAAQHRAGSNAPKSANTTDSDPARGGSGGSPSQAGDAN
ncbi:MAG: hypothetical protein ABWY93_29045 [Mycobacterium sp.]